MSVDRRTFLKLGGASLFGVALAPLLGGCETIVDPDRTLEGFTPFITPTDRFYVQHGGRDTIPGWSMPDISRETWVMQIKGEVLTPMTITFGDLEAAAAAGASRTILKTMRCVLDSHVRPGALGWTGNAYWKGIPLRYFLDRAGLDRENTNRITFRGADAFQNNITLERFGAADLGPMEPLLVYEMNREPLRREHGGPVRLLLLETYGFKSVKWLTEVNASIFDNPTGQYQREGFDDDGIIRVSSRSENFSENLRINAGLVEITGFAVSGEGSVTGVEVSIDDGAYAGAEIEPLERLLNGVSLPPDIAQLADRHAYPYRGVWTKWRFRWSARTGDHTISIRARDSAGKVQEEDDDLLIRDGQTGVIRYNVRVS
jgi:DMSO/TMAO reductase YedYZ molybdopterin-dependent catalytic subunit